jgi:hypothetical protein
MRLVVPVVVPPVVLDVPLVVCADTAPNIITKRIPIRFFLLILTAIFVFLLIVLLTPP